MQHLDREIAIDPTEGDATYRDLFKATVEVGAPIDHDAFEALLEVVAPGTPPTAR